MSDGDKTVRRVMPKRMIPQCLRVQKWYQIIIPAGKWELSAIQGKQSAMPWEPPLSHVGATS